LSLSAPHLPHHFVCQGAVKERLAGHEPLRPEQHQHQRSPRSQVRPLSTCSRYLAQELPWRRFVAGRDSSIWYAAWFLASCAPPPPGTAAERLHDISLEMTRSGRLRPAPGSSPASPAPFAGPGRPPAPDESAAGTGTHQQAGSRTIELQRQGVRRLQQQVREPPPPAGRLRTRRPGTQKAAIQGPAALAFNALAGTGGGADYVASIARQPPGAGASGEACF